MGQMLGKIVIGIIGAYHFYKMVDYYRCPSDLNAIVCGVFTTVATPFEYKFTEGVVILLAMILSVLLIKKA